MKNIIFNDLQKKKKHVGIRVSKAERKMLFEFCQREHITLTDLVRYAIGKVFNQETNK